MSGSWLRVALPLLLVALVALLLRGAGDADPGLEVRLTDEPAPAGSPSLRGDADRVDRASVPTFPAGPPPVRGPAPAAPAGPCLRVTVRELGTSARLGGVTVRVIREERRFGEGVTDARGVAELPLPADGELRVEARSDRHLPAARAVAAGAGGPTAVELCLDPGERVAVRVEQDGTGKPLEGAEIRWWHARAGLGRSARTGPDGSAELPGLPPGDWVEGRLQARCPGLLTLRAGDGRGFVRTGPRAVCVRMVRAARVSGRVLDPDGQALGSALVHVDLEAETFRMLDPPTSDAEDGGRPLATGMWCRTDSEGRFALPCFPPLDRVALAVCVPGWAPETRWIRLAAGEERGSFVIRLGGGGEIRGEVRDPDGRCVPGATVCVARRDRLLVQLTCDEHGAFRVRGLRAGPHALKARAAGWVESPVRSIALPSNRRIADVGLALRRPAPPLTGRIVDDEGGPRSGVEVVARGVSRPGVFVDETYWPARDETDADGRFRLEGLRGDWTYSVEVNAPGTALPVTRGPLRAPFPELHIEVARPGGIVVVVPEELRSELTHVSAVRIDDPNAIVVRSLEGPSVTIGGLLPGRYRIGGSAGGARVAAAPEVVVTAGHTVRGGRLVRLAGSDLAGRVVDASGVPLAGVRVATLEAQPGREPRLRSVRTDARGRFSLHGLAAAAHDLVIGDVGLGFTVVRGVPQRARDLAVTFAATAAVHVVVRDAATEEPVGGAEVALLTRGLGAVHLRTGHQGQTTFRITPGDYALVVVAEGYQHTGCRVSVPPAGREVLREFRLLGERP